MRLNSYLLGLILGVFLSFPAWAMPFHGTYSDGSGTYQLKLQNKGPFVKGRFVGKGSLWTVDAMVEKGVLKGILVVSKSPYKEYVFQLSPQGKNQVLKFWREDQNNRVIKGTKKSVVLYPHKGKPTAAIQKSTGVYINKSSLTPQHIQWLQKKYRIKIQRGSYWYDSKSGLWGIQGGPALGVILPHLKLGGKLLAHASNGRTGVFVNGRQLHPIDVAQLQMLLGQVIPGKYWLDGKGNVGQMGKKRALLNVYKIAKMRQAKTFYRNSYTGTGSGSSGGSGYVMGKNWSVSW